ncbi:MAG: hypothetical protein HYU66_07075 [Armatimonadetes bacterium]|nr:hypothetical protein [Armatimonadota bacterium]
MRTSPTAWLRALLLAPALHAAPLSSRVTTDGGVTRVVVANRFFELTFEPARGGRCSGFRFLDNGEQIIPADPVSGLFLDHWAKYPWPSGLMHLPYQHELVRDGDARLGVRLWVTVPAMGGGKGAQDAASSLAIPTSPDLIGLIVRKTIWIRADQDLIEVEQEVENSTAESRGVAIYTQQVATMGGRRFLNNWYLPSSRGVLVNVQGKDDTDRSIGPDWVADPTAGWMAVLHRQTRRGLLFAFDYNYVEKIYTCGSTAEWFFQSVPVAPGHRFQTRYVVKPLRGLADVVHGSANLVCDLRPRESGTAVKVTSLVAAVSRELDHVTLDFTVTGWRSKAVLLTKRVALPHVGSGTVRSEFGFTPKALKDGVVIAVRAVSPAGEERYEVYYAGDRDAHERRYNYFATQGGALAGAKGATYYRNPPRQGKPLDKPDFATLPRPAADRLRCLVVFGLYTQMLRLDDALEGWQPAGRAAPEFTWANAPPNAAEGFPGSYEELFGYHVVVLSDVNQKSLGDIGLEMLCDWVEQGGSLLVAGGPYALGNGEYEDTRLVDLLPVKLAGPFDLKWSGAGQSWPLAPAAGGHALTEGVGFGAAPRVYWQHAVTPKPEAEVVLEAGGRPALVLGRYGKGRVAVLTLSPTGEPAAGEVAWWVWDGWPRLVRNVVGWLGEGGAR